MDLDPKKRKPRCWSLVNTTTGHTRTPLEEGAFARGKDHGQDVAFFCLRICILLAFESYGKIFGRVESYIPVETNE